MKYYYSLHRKTDNMTKEDVRERTERFLNQFKALQELPLILTPEDFFDKQRELHAQLDGVKFTLNTWMSGARENDEMLRIEREFIPYIVIYIPDTSEGEKFFTIARAIGEIPMVTGVIPRNQNQGYWLKTLHYFYQARGVLFAYKLLGVISNPLGENGLFNKYLPETSIQNLELLTNVDLAEYNLIKNGEKYIQEWVGKKNIVYPFQHPFDLFLEIRKQAFLNGWNLGSGSHELEWLSVEDQKEIQAIRIRLLEQNPWIKGEEKRGLYSQREKEYIKFLKNHDWYGHFVLALRAQQQWNLTEEWQEYTNRLKAAKSAYIDDFYWQRGQPYKAKEIQVDRLPHKTRKIKTRQRVEGIVDDLGYIRWQWL